MKLFKYSLLLSFIFSNIFCEQKLYLCKLSHKISYIEESVSINYREEEGFLEGTLVKTLRGFTPVEKLRVGDLIAGISDYHKIINIKKKNVSQYILLETGNNSVFCATHQKFYLYDNILQYASDIQPGDYLYNGSCVDTVRLFKELRCTYSLSTEQQHFFIYPNIYVHNSDVISMGITNFAISLGVIEMFNPIVIIVGGIVALSWYAHEYFRSHQGDICEIDVERHLATSEKTYLEDIHVIEETRVYYEIKRKQLWDLYQSLVKINNNLAVFIRPKLEKAEFFSVKFLSLFASNASHDNFFSDASYKYLRVKDREKLIKIWDLELEKMQQEIFNVCLVLCFHLNEIIERRDGASVELEQFYFHVESSINAWNSHLEYMSHKIAFTSYALHFFWKEHLENLEIKTKEVKFVIAYYKSIKEHDFVCKITNLDTLLEQEEKINDSILEDIKIDKEIVISNMVIFEYYLQKNGLLSQLLVNQYLTQARQFRFSQEKDAISHARKKKESAQNIIYNQLKESKNDCATGLLTPDPHDKNKKERKVNQITKSEFLKKEAIKSDYEYWQDGIYKRKSGSKGLDHKTEYFKWDNLHNDVEGYDKSKIHLGSIDPQTLQYYKPAVIGRTIR